MSTATLTTIVEPLVKRKLFATTEEAMLELMQDYTPRQVSSYQRQSLGRALMAEEDDWLDWKVATEMLRSWLGLREEVEGVG